MKLETERERKIHPRSSLWFGGFRLHAKPEIWKLMEKERERKKTAIEQISKFMFGSVHAMWVHHQRGNVDDVIEAGAEDDSGVIETAHDYNIT